MNLLLTFMLLSTTAVTTSMASIGFWPQMSSDGKCRSTDGKSYAVGESWPTPGKCEESYCIQGMSENEVVVRFESCGSISPQNGCTVKYDKTKEFPGCCIPIYECE